MKIKPHIYEIRYLQECLDLAFNCDNTTQDRNIRLLHQRIVARLQQSGKKAVVSERTIRRIFAFNGENGFHELSLLDCVQDDLELISTRKNVNDLSEDFLNSQYLQQEEELSERETTIHQLVADMQEPCNTLLKLYYWEKKDGQQIATLLNYKNPDSVKTQKFKCMKKLKTTLMNRLKESLYDK